MQLEDINIRKRNEVFNAYQALLYAAKLQVKADCLTSDEERIKEKYGMDYFYGLAFSQNKIARRIFPNVIPKREDQNPAMIQAETMQRLGLELGR